MSSNLVMRTKRSRSVNATSAGTSNVNGAVVDMVGFEGVVFTGAFGTLTSTQVTGMKVQVGNAANLSDAVDLVGASVGPLADADGNKLLVLEVHKFPVGYRYCRVVVTRGTANAVIDSVTAEQYGAHKQPESDDATTVSASLVSVEPSISNSALTSTTVTPSGTTTQLNTTARNSS